MTLKPLVPAPVGTSYGSREGGLIVSLSKSRRFEVFKRDGFTCQYCGSRPPDVVLEVDHIQPRSKGGDDDELNLITSCVECNRGKAAKLLAEVIPRPDADLKLLETQQEMVEIRRYQEALVVKEEFLKRGIALLQQLWMDCAGDDIDWCPTDRVMRQFMNRFSPEIVEEAFRDVAPKVATGYISQRGDSWLRYLWSVMRNLANES